MGCDSQSNARHEPYCVATEFDKMDLLGSTTVPNVYSGHGRERAVVDMFHPWILSSKHITPIPPTSDSCHTCASSKFLCGKFCCVGETSGRIYAVRNTRRPYSVTRLSSTLPPLASLLSRYCQVSPKGLLKALVCCVILPTFCC